MGYTIIFDILDDGFVGKYISMPSLFSISIPQAIEVVRTFIKPNWARD